MIGTRDVTLKQDRPTELLLEKHEKYLKNYANSDSGTEQIMSEYLKMSGMYWGLNALYLMKKLDENSQMVTSALEFIKECQGEDGGFSAAPKHDSHILHTLSSVQMLVILDKCQSDFIDIDKCVTYVSSLQQHDGSFFGDKWGEIDTRFSFCGLATLKLLNRLDAIDLDKAIEFIMRCNNQIDGGFGRLPGSESHAAYIYCCVGSLAIAGQLNQIPDPEQLGGWLAERQLTSGGLNGRPEKLPDLCYSWWCLSSLKMISKIHLIDHKRLLDFILACQDVEQGGFSDRPGNWVDPYHTMFGLASISLITHHYVNLTSDSLVNSYPDKKAELSSQEENPKNISNVEFLKRFGDILKPVNPVLCMPEECLISLKSNLS